jgi:hypothetical protein
MSSIITPSVCFPRLPLETTEQVITQMFQNVERVDMVVMVDNKDQEFKMAFVHFNNPELMRSFVEHIAQHAFYMNGWLVRPNYKPVKPSTRKWTPEELEEIEQYFSQRAN